MKDLLKWMTGFFWLLTGGFVFCIKVKLIYNGMGDWLDYVISFAAFHTAFYGHLMIKKSTGK